MKICWVLLSLLLSMPLYSQIKINDRSFPKEGDTSLFYVDNLPSNIDPGAQGPDQRWNFMTLQSPFVRRSTWTNPAQSLAGKRFAGAELCLKIDENTEAYFRREADQLELLGYFGSDPFGIGIRSLFRYEQPIVEERRKLEYGDLSSSRYEMSATLTLDDLPLPLRQTLPVTPDSLRLHLVSQRVDEVDAWGTLVMPGGFFDVLREKRSEARSLRMEVKVGQLPWQDITKLLPENEVFGNHVFLSYHFYSDEVPEALIKIRMKADNSGIEQVIYRANNPEESVQDIDAIYPGVYAFPNPAIVNVRFEFTKLDPGRYRLSIMNILGVDVWSESYFITGNETKKIDISFLRKGTYLYALQDEEGKILMTKRLVVIRP